MIDQSGICICHVRSPDSEQDEYYVTLLRPEQMAKTGLCPEAVMGKLTEPLTSHMAITPERFVPNGRFVEFMHKVIARFAPEEEDFRGEAANRQHGTILIVDARTPTPNEQVPPEDILGAFEICDGRASAATYHPFPHHRILTETGFVKLPGRLQEILVTELARRNAETR